MADDEQRALERAQRTDRLVVHKRVAGVADVVEVWKGKLAETTRRVYVNDLCELATFLEAETASLGRPQIAALVCKHLIELGHAEATQTLFAWRTEMVQGALSSAVINRRLSAVKSFLAMANSAGLVSWLVKVPLVKKERRVDRAGPSPDAVKKMLVTAKTTRKPERDYAVITLLANLGLRRVEVLSARVEDVDLEKKTIAVLRKGRRERVTLHLTDPAVDALRGWLAERGMEPGTLFPVHANTIYRIVRDVGELSQAGHVRPHGLRHTGITQVLDATDGNLVAAQAFSGHSDVRVLQDYDDRRAARQAEAADLLGVLYGGVVELSARDAWREIVAQMNDGRWTWTHKETMFVFRKRCAYSPQRPTFREALAQLTVNVELVELPQHPEPLLPMFQKVGGPNGSADHQRLKANAYTWLKQQGHEDVWVEDAPLEFDGEGRPDLWAGDVIAECGETSYRKAIAVLLTKRKLLLVPYTPRSDTALLFSPRV